MYNLNLRSRLIWRAAVNSSVYLCAECLQEGGDGAFTELKEGNAILTIFDFGRDSNPLKRRRNDD